MQMDGPLLRGGFQPLSPQARLCDFWAVSQEMGADFAMGPGLLGGCRRESFAVELADLGKYRRMVVFRAGSACETARSLQFTGGVRGKQWDGRPLQGELVTSTAFRLALTKRRREAVAC